MTRLRSLTTLVAALAIAAAACSGTATVDTGGSASDITVEAPAPFTSVDPQEAATYVTQRLGDADFVLLDVRTPQEVAEGVIPGATVGYDFYDPGFVDRISGLDRNAEYVLYCRSGNRSGQTLQLMRQLGFTNVSDIAGGIQAWESAGLDVAGP